MNNYSPSTEYNQKCGLALYKILRIQRNWKDCAFKSCPAVLLCTSAAKSESVGVRNGQDGQL